MVLGMTEYIAAGAAALFAGTIITYEINVNGLEKDLLACGKEKAELQLSVEKFRDALTVQNKAIDNLKIDYDLAIIELEDWKSKPAEVKYKYIYETVVKEINVTRGDCNDTTLLIESIKHIDFSQL